jgi:hypothetical protein
MLYLLRGLFYIFIRWYYYNIKINDILQSSEECYWLKRLLWLGTN